MPFLIEECDGCLHIRLFGVLTEADVQALIMEVEALEAALTRVRHVIETTEVTRFDIYFKAMFAAARRRAKTLFSAPTRTAIIADKPVHFGMGRMYQSLNENPQIEIRILGNRSGVGE